MINPDKDTGRLDYIRREVTCAGLSFERLPGVCGTDLSPAQKSYSCDSDGVIASPIERGQIGRHAAGLGYHTAIVRLSSPSNKAVSPVAEPCNGCRLLRCTKTMTLAGAYLISKAGDKRTVRAFLGKRDA